MENIYIGIVVAEGEQYGMVEGWYKFGKRNAKYLLQDFLGHEIRLRRNLGYLFKGVYLCFKKGEKVFIFEHIGEYSSLSETFNYEKQGEKSYKEWNKEKFNAIFEEMKKQNGTQIKISHISVG